MKAPFRRRLDDRHDKYAFFAAFFGGLVGIFFLRLIGGSSRGVTAWDVAAIIFAITVLIGYGLYIYFSKNRSSVSIDRASDNIYYLGLLFTLASLAYSLVLLSKGFNPESGRNSGLVLSLLPDFGLALFSTIFGIFGRIVLQQMRNDPMNIEMEARDELGLAIRQLRQTIGQVVTNLNGLSDQTSLTLSELNQTISRTLEQSANENTNVIRGVADEVTLLSSKLQQQVTDVTRFTAAVNQRFNDMLENMKTQFEGLTEIPQTLNKKFGDLGETVSSATEQVARASSSQTALAGEMLNAVGALKTAFSDAGLARISGIVETAETKFSEINDELKKNEMRLTETLGGIDTQVEALNAASSSLATYERKIESSAKSIDEINNEYIEGLSKATENLRKKTEQI